MAVNGAVARLSFDPPSTSARAKPAAPPVAIQIGTAMADAVEALGASLADFDAGSLTATNRTRGGVTVAAVVELWLHHFGEIDDFRGLAQREGRRVLLERHAAALRQQLGADVPEAAIAGTFDELCGHIITVAKQVTAIELAYRSN